MAGIIPVNGAVQQLGLVLGGVLKCRLYKNDVVPTVNSTLADFVAADFPGYGDQQIQPGMAGPNGNQLGQAVATSQILTWTRTAGTGPQTVFGYVVIFTSGAGDTIFGAERFALARPINAENDALILQVSVILAGSL